jgi:RNA polymerase primary sigma factor
MGTRRERHDIGLGPFAPAPTREEQLRNARRARRGDRAAFDALVTSNLRLVASVARRFTGRGVPLEDLVQSGTLGLMTAAKRFDPRRGCAFGTFAVWWIRQACGRTVQDQARLIRVPVHALAAAYRARRELRERLGHEPTHSELLSAYPGLAFQIRASARSALSFDYPASDGDDTLHDSVASKAPSPWEGIAETDESEHVRGMLQRLTRREREVIELRYYGGESLEEASETMGVQRETARALEARALDKLRRMVGREAA